MTDNILSLKSVGEMVGGLISGGGVSSIAGAIDKGLALILRLTEEDPVKRAKALREYEMELMELIKEAPNAKDKDLTDISLAFIRLLDGK